MQPSDFPAPFGRDFGSPCQRPTSMQALVLCRPRVRLPTRGTSETGHRLSATPGSFEERRGPPGLLGRPLRARRGRTPRRIRPLLAPTSLWEDPRRGRRRLQGKQNPRHPERHNFRGRNPTAHTLVCLRFAGLVAGTGAKAHYRLGRAHPWPGGFRTRWTTNEVSWSHRIPPIPFDQQGLVARRVARGSHPPRALSRSGQGDFHHPAPP